MHSHVVFFLLLFLNDFDFIENFIGFIILLEVNLAVLII